MQGGASQSQRDPWLGTPDGERWRHSPCPGVGCYATSAKAMRPTPHDMDVGLGKSAKTYVGWAAPVTGPHTPRGMPEQTQLCVDTPTRIGIFEPLVEQAGVNGIFRSPSKHCSTDAYDARSRLNAAACGNTPQREARNLPVPHRARLAPQSYRLCAEGSCEPNGLVVIR